MENKDKKSLDDILKDSELLEEGFLGMGNQAVVGKVTNEGMYDDDEEEKQITSEEKQEFLEAVAKYNEYAKSIYREHSLKEVVQQIKEIGKKTEKLVFQEADNWYDQFTIKKEMKQLGESVKLFEKTAMEVSQLQHRLESLYEVIGTGLNKYFDINDNAPTIEGE